MMLKFCGLRSPESARIAGRLGADFCGFIFHPRSPRAISPEKASGMNVGGARRVGVFVEQETSEILGIMRQATLDFAQLHGHQGIDCARAIGPERTIRVLWPARLANLQALQLEINAWTDYCAMFLLDAGMAGGGHGVELDWEALASLQFPRPWLLAGGLNHQNIRQAARLCGPAGVDVNSGAESEPGVKDYELMRLAALAAGKEAN